MLIEFIIYLSSIFVLTVFLKVQLNFVINVIYKKISEKFVELV